MSDAKLDPRLTDADARRMQRIQVGLGLVALVAIVVSFSRGYGTQVVAGVSDGAIYALAGLGLVLTYKTSGIFNLAVGAQAAASAYVFYSFRIQAGIPWPVAALLTLLLVGLLGSLVLERIAYWLSDAPAVMRVAATIGVMVLLQSLLTGAYGGSTIVFQPFLSTKSTEIGGITIVASQVMIVVFGLLATIGLALFFRNARLGVAMQAVVDDASLLDLDGTSPVAVRRLAWAIGSSFISISGMLIAPIIGIDVNQMLLFFIAAFGSAAIGGFSSLPITFISAIAIGITSNVMSAEFSTSQNLMVAGLYTQVPFIALVAAFVLLPRARLRDSGARRPRPPVSVPRNISLPFVAAAVACGVAVPEIVSEVNLNQYTTGLGFAIVIASLGLLVWDSGQISLCHAAFAAIGATTFAKAQSAGMPYLLALLTAGLLTLFVGAVVSIPSFRLSGTYLAVATFGFGILCQNMLYATSLMFTNVNTRQLERPQLFGMDTDSDKGYYYVALTIFLACVGLIVMVRRSRLGRILRALADSPAALDAHAANTRLSRMFVFCISAFIAAVGGAVIAGVTQAAAGTVTGPFSYFNSLIMVAVLVFCGKQPILSPLLAAFLFVVLRVYHPFSDPTFVKYQGVIFGALAIGVAILPAVRIRAVERRIFEREGRRAFPPRTTHVRSAA
jgi:branched-subunit amino acid ABC-type transport system permease component